MCLVLVGILDTDISIRLEQIAMGPASEYILAASGKYYVIVYSA